MGTEKVMERTHFSVGEKLAIRCVIRALVKTHSDPDALRSAVGAAFDEEMKKWATKEGGGELEGELRKFTEGLLKSP
jgi:hypothetical protein